MNTPIEEALNEERENASKLNMAYFWFGISLGVSISLILGGVGIWIANLLHH